MGNPIDEDDPEWKSCEDCCIDIPEYLNAKVNCEPWGEFTGQLHQNHLDPCVFMGPLQCGAQYGSLLVEFCDGDTANTALFFQDPLNNWHGATVENNSGYPKIGITGDDGAYYGAWP